LEKKRKVLGRGLGALLPATDTSSIMDSKKTYLLCPIERIHPNPYQPRDVFDDAKLKELIDSVREKGIIQPLIVRKNGANEYELIAGERRWRAAQKVGLKEVPVVIKDVSDRESLEIAIIEAMTVLLSCSLPITGPTVYTLSCEPYPGYSFSDKEKTVKVIPVFREL